MAENTGQRRARPMPLRNTMASSNGGLIRSSTMAAHSSTATSAIHSWVKRK
jgi:hypothetical protein